MLKLFSTFNTVIFVYFQKCSSKKAVRGNNTVTPAVLTLQEYGSILSVSEPSSSHLRYQMLIDTNGVRMRAAWFYTDDLGDEATIETPAVSVDFEHWYLMSVAWDNIDGLFRVKLHDVSTQELLAAAQSASPINTGSVRDDHVVRRPCTCSFSLTPPDTL